MPKTKSKEPSDYIVPLELNGLKGRLLRLPPKKPGQREILFIYGQHSSLERWWGLAQALNEFGGVTMPDMPGFGGMTSLYKIGQVASIDNLADYLADFVKNKLEPEEVTLAAMSLAFAVATRMLQRHPELAGRVTMLVSIVGLAHYEDFIFSPARSRFYRSAARFFSFEWPAAFFQGAFLQPFYLRRAYKYSRFAKEKLAELSGDEFKRTMDTEMVLWKINDLRTQMKTNHEMFTLNNCNQRLDLPVYHVASKHDRYFDHERIEAHFKLIFRSVTVFYTQDPNHAPTIVATAAQAAPFIPDGLAREFTKTDP